jgi:hypothetical protein
MSKLPSNKKIPIEEFPKEVKGWIPGLLDPINRFMDEVTRALNRGLTIKENMNGDIRTFVCDGNYPINLKWDLKARPVAAFIGQCREVSENHTTITEALYLDWEFNQAGMIQINNIADLNASAANKFNVTIIVFTG